jgi:hypothetical protein
MADGMTLRYWYTRVVASGGILFMFTHWGCAALTSADDEESNCETSSDCPCMQFCKAMPSGASVCTPGCEHDQDCPGSGMCSDERCDCLSSRYVCVRGKCALPCDNGPSQGCGSQCCSSYSAVCAGDVCCESGVACGTSCCADSYLAVCMGDACCESGVVCGTSCCASSIDTCCGDECCDEVCAGVGYYCNGTADCCGHEPGNTVCVSSNCAATCSPEVNCSNGCCVALVGGGGACLAAEYCAMTCSTSAECATNCCVSLIDGGGVCAPASACL